MSKFEADLNVSVGCMLGVLCGDCLGSDLEGCTRSGEILGEVKVSRHLRYLKDIHGIETEKAFSNTRRIMYTDDTAMTKDVARAIVETLDTNNDIYFDLELAKQFAQTYLKEVTLGIHRGYGKIAEHLIRQLLLMLDQREMLFLNNSTLIDEIRYDKAFEQRYKCKCCNSEWLDPASSVFKGEGSFGNGGSMRVAPIAIAFRHNLRSCCYYAAVQARITHANEQGILGAVFQAAAIWLTLQEGIKQQTRYHCDRRNFPFDNWLSKLEATIAEIEMPNGILRFIPQSLAEYQKKHTKSETPIQHSASNMGGCRCGEAVFNIRGDQKNYSGAVQDLRNMLMSYCVDEEDELSRLRYECVARLGNNITALGSVPTAAFAFLLALRYGSDDWGIQEIIAFALTFGGDTDTIASMTGALAGAYFGSDEFLTPEVSLLKACEGWEEMIVVSKELLRVSPHINEISSSFINVSCRFMHNWKNA